MNNITYESHTELSFGNEAETENNSVFILRGFLYNFLRQTLKRLWAERSAADIYRVPRCGRS